MDGLGSVTALVEDASGVVEERYQYDSFGQPTILAPDGMTFPPKTGPVAPGVSGW